MGIHGAITASAPGAGDYQSCDAAADAPNQEIIDLAASLKNDPGLIFHFVHDTIDVEPTFESSKGAFGTYLDRSGNSFDQSSLLVALLKAAASNNSQIGTIQFVIGTTTLTRSQVGMPPGAGGSNNLPQQLLIDAGDTTANAAASIVPYAWVQVQVGGQWVVMDPAGKTYTVLTGANISAQQPAQPSMTSSAIQTFLSTFSSNIYNSQGTASYGSISAYAGGRRINVSPTSTNYNLHGFTYTSATGNPGSTSSPLAFSTMPYNYRTVLEVTLQGTPPQGVLCVDQIYGHDVMYSYTYGGIRVDNTLVYSQGQSNSPVSASFVLVHQIWQSNNLTYPWTQTALETFPSGSVAYFEFGIGRINSFRAQHETSIDIQIEGAQGTHSADQYYLGTSDVQLSQTSRTTELLDQLAGTYTINHHAFALVHVAASGNTNSTSIDIPMTATSVDSVTSTPASGLVISPQAVPYALSALQSSQEAAALAQANAPQSVSAATLMGALPSPSSLIYVPAGTNPSSNTTLAANYSTAQLTTMYDYTYFGYDVVVPSAPSAWGSTANGAAPFTASAAGSSAFVLQTPTGIYKGASNEASTPAYVDVTGLAGQRNVAGPGGRGLTVDPGSGKVSFAAPLLSIGSNGSPFSLTFSAAYSSDSSAQQTYATPDVPGWSHNYEISLNQATDAYGLIGSDLAGPASPGLATLFYLLQTGNQMATYYSSGGTYPVNAVFASSVGANWFLAQATNDTVSISQGASQQVFMRLPNGTYGTAVPSGAKLALANNVWTLTSPHGATMTFPGAGGGVTETRDAVATAANNGTSGVNTAFTYTTISGYSLLQTVSNGVHTLTFSYAAAAPTPAGISPKLQTVSDETGRSVSFAQGTTAYHWPDSTITLVDNTSQAPRTLSFVYLPNNAYNPFAPAYALLSSVNDPMNYGTSVAFDSRQVATSLTNANSHKTSYYIAPNRSEIDDALGNASYSVSYPVVFFADYLVTDSYDPLGNRTELTYNYAGQLLGKTLPDTPYCSGCGYSYTYDAHGNLASTAIGPTTNNQQILTSTTWDQTWNKPHLVTDPLLRVTTYNYDPTNGNLLSIVKPTVDGTQNTPAPTETLTYWPTGLLESTTVDGTQWGLTQLTMENYYYYNSTTKNLQYATVDYGTGSHLNLTTNVTFDAVGNLSSVQTPNGHTTTMPQYDKARRLLTKMTPAISADGGNQYATTYTYNANGWLTQTSQDATASSPRAQLVSTTGYDNVGNVTNKTVPTTGTTNHTITYAFDADERLLTTTTPTSSSTNLVKTQTYDADSRLYQEFTNGNLTASHLYNGDGLPSVVADPQALLNSPSSTAHKVGYTYDNYDRLTQTTYGDGSTETLVLDNASRVTSRTDRSNNKITYVYDNLDRLSTESLPNSSTVAITTTYNLINQPLTVTDSTGAFSYAYDTASRQAQTTRPDGKVVGYTYDADNNTSTITYPDQYTYTYTYDELDRMKKVSETGAPSGYHVAGQLATYSYNPLSQLTNSTPTNTSLGTAYGYDAFNGLQSLGMTFASTSNPTSATYAYTRDYMERRTGDSVSVATQMWHPPVAGTDTYTAGTSGLNQYAAINGQALNYDSSGNLNGDASAPLGSATYGFDYQKRLISATNGQHSATYTYDAFSRRSSKTVDGTQTVYVSDGSRVLAEYTAAGAETQHYIYGVGNAPIAYELFNGNPNYSAISLYFVDGLGSVVSNVSNAGNVAHIYAYSPYGESSTLTGTSYGFAGMRYDPETALYYDNARYYSPKQGRFISPDPIGVKGGINMYAYVTNDPLNKVDPSGLEPGLGLAGDPQFEMDSILDDVFAALDLPSFDIGLPSNLPGDDADDQDNDDNPDPPASDPGTNTTPQPTSSDPGMDPNCTADNSCENVVVTGTRHPSTPWSDPFPDNNPQPIPIQYATPLPDNDNYPPGTSMCSVARKWCNMNAPPPQPGVDDHLNFRSACTDAYNTCDAYETGQRLPNPRLGAGVTFPDGGTVWFPPGGGIPIYINPSKINP
jgi:RHS repeat-associated protein